MNELDYNETNRFMEGFFKFKFFAHCFYRTFIHLRYIELNETIFSETAA